MAELSNDGLVARLLGKLLVVDTPAAEGAPLLAQLGMSNSDIAAIYGTTESSIRSAVSKKRKTKGAADDE